MVNTIEPKKLRRHFRRKDLIKDGPSKFYYASGGLRKVEYYCNNKNNGYERTFYQHGSIESECIRKENDFIETVYYNKSGKKEYTMETNKEEKYRKFTSFHENGRPKFEGSYRDYLLDGDVKIYDTDSSLSRNEVFKKNKSIKVLFCKEKASTPLVDTLKITMANTPPILTKTVLRQDSFIYASMKIENGKITKADYYGPECFKKEVLDWINTMQWESEKINGKENNSHVVLAYNLAESRPFKISRDFRYDIYESEYIYANANIDKVYKNGQKMPGYPGGMNEMMDYLSKNIKYPEEAIENGIQGKVVVRFTICEDGSMCNFNVVRGVSPEVDNEAIRVVSGMPQWTPGLQFGKPVPVYFTLPISFKLK